MGKRRVLARYTKRSLRNTKLLLVSVHVFYDRFDGDECLEDVLVRAGKYIKALKDWKNDLSGENSNSSTNG